MKTGDRSYDAVKSYLEAQRDRICAEICAYPTPIPACDVHFNRLLEERTGIFEVLRRLAGLMEGQHDSASLEDFIESSAAIDDEHKVRLATLLGRT